MCKQDTASVKLALESVLSNRREFLRYTLDQVFAKGVISGGGLSPGGYLRTPGNYTGRDIAPATKLSIRTVRLLHINSLFGHANLSIPPTWRCGYQ